MEDRITVSVPREMKLHLEYLAKTQGVSISEIIRNIIDSSINNKDDDKFSSIFELLMYLRPIIENIDSFNARNSIFLNEYSKFHLEPELHKKLRADVALEKKKYDFMKGYLKE